MAPFPIPLQPFTIPQQHSQYHCSISPAAIALDNTYSIKKQNNNNQTKNKNEII
jgi:hypothetical protein